jgi:hypothetical protein
MLLQRIWLAGYQFFFSSEEFAIQLRSHPIPFLNPTSSEPYAGVKRDVIARGILTNSEDLARNLRRYINAYSANAKPIQWRYSDSTRRIRSNVVSAKCH